MRLRGRVGDKEAGGTYAAVLAICPNNPGPWEAAPAPAGGVACVAGGAACVVAGRVCCCERGAAGARAGTVGREGAERGAERWRGILRECVVWLGRSEVEVVVDVCKVETGCNVERKSEVEVWRSAGRQKKSLYKRFERPIEAGVDIITQYLLPRLSSRYNLHPIPVINIPAYIVKPSHYNIDWA